MRRDSEAAAADPYAVGAVSISGVRLALRAVLNSLFGRRDWCIVQSCGQIYAQPTSWREPDETLLDCRLSRTAAVKEARRRKEAAHYRCTRCGRDEFDAMYKGCERGPCPMEFIG